MEFNKSANVKINYLILAIVIIIFFCNIYHYKSKL